MARIINNNEFDTEVLKGSGVSLVDFFADWCGPCKMLSPILDSITDTVKGKAKILKVNVDDCQDLAREYNIVSVPTIIIFKDGEIVERITGFQSADALIKIIDQHA